MVSVEGSYSVFFFPLSLLHLVTRKQKTTKKCFLLEMWFFGNMMPLPFLFLLKLHNHFIRAAKKKREKKKRQVHSTSHC